MLGCEVKTKKRWQVVKKKDWTSPDYTMREESGYSSVGETRVNREIMCNVLMFLL
jgi:hypothetical protein